MTAAVWPWSSPALDLAVKEMRHHMSTGRNEGGKNRFSAASALQALCSSKAILLPLLHRQRQCMHFQSIIG